MSLRRLTPVLALALFACHRAEPVDPTQPNPGAHAMAGGLSREAIERAAFAPPPPPTPNETSQPAPSKGSTTDAPRGQKPRPQAQLIRAQILLDRTRFSPGVIDGLDGENSRQAIAAFEKAQNLPVDGELDAQVLDRLARQAGRPVLADYVITAQDVAGPFIGPMPENLEALAKLPSVGFSTAREALAEKFHITEDLLAALNPGVDFTRAGTRLVVPSVGPDPLPGLVKRITVDKAEKSVRAFAGDGTLLAFYPATIGSSDRPAPSGRLTVNGVANEPTYTYDPSRLTYGSGRSKVVVPPGPNNPVGTVWIDLSRDTYGIHGAPDPSSISKAASHGCVRLTNWDAEQLAAATKPGVEVVFS